MPYNPPCTHHTLVATLDLARWALDLVSTHAIDAVKTGGAQLAACTAVLPVGLQVLAPAVAHVLVGGAQALAVLAGLAGLVAALTALATVLGVLKGVLREGGRQRMGKSAKYKSETYPLPGHSACNREGSDPASNA